MKNSFCAFILTHGRPDNVYTFEYLKKHGYTGMVYLVIDNEDKKAEQYYKKYPGQVLMFHKADVAHRIDEGDNFEDRRAIIYARNACFELAKQIGVRYFVELDDDYYWFGHRTETGGKSTRHLDDIFDSLVDFLEVNKNIASVAFSQGGDHIGGFNKDKQISRKAMNSFVCDAERPFEFSGRINEDVNTYTSLGLRGKIFFTIMNIQLDQKDTQSNSGGMTYLYVLSGTYVKSFYTVMYSPSCARVALMNCKHPRLHHKIMWGNAVPCIIQERYKVT